MKVLRILALATGSVAGSAAFALDVTIGATNQTGINNAINQVAAAGGGTVFMNAGTYTITGSVLMKGKVALDGVGTSTYVRGTSSSNTFHNIECSTDNSDNMTVRDMKVDTWLGTGIGVHITASTINDDNNRIIAVEQFNSNSHGINGGGQNALTIQNCYVHTSGNVNGPSHNFYWRRYNNVNISGTRSLDSRGCGFKMSWGTSLTFTSCTCTGNDQDGIITQHTTDQPVSGVNVNSCTLTSNNRGTYLFGAGLHVNSTTANNNTTAGLYVNANPASPSSDMHNNNACGNGGGHDYDIHGYVSWTGSSYNNKKCGVVQ